jgi:endonuclease-3
VKFLENLESNLSKMRKIARRRKAPVLNVEQETKNNPFKILVFTMLSARTRDSTTIKVVNRIFSKANSPEKIVRLGRKNLETLLYGVGFYREKTKYLIATCKILAKTGKVPDSIDKLLTLPGVGRKTANIVLARAFGKQTLGVDVHVHRISNRLGIVKTKRPEDTEQVLVRLVPKRYLSKLNLYFVSFGQTVCLPIKPDCRNCPMKQICEKVGL